MEEISISNVFVKEEVPIAPPIYVSIYLLTKAIGKHATAIQIAQELDSTTDEILRAWRYWEERGYPLFAQSDTSQTPRILPPKPEYQEQELSMYAQNRNMKRLFIYAEKTLGKTLSSSELLYLFGLHDWLRLPIDVIELLLEYCAKNKKTNIRYIEKVGIAWAEDGIDTIQKAREHLYGTIDYQKEIMRAFGLQRLPGIGEEKYIKKWVEEYHMSLELILLACEKSLLSTQSQISFVYTDSILTNWYQNQVRTVADVTKLDATHETKKEQQKEKQKSYKQKATNKPKNRFINYTQREWDFDRLEQLEREQRNQSIRGNDY